MNLDVIRSLLKSLSHADKKKLLDEWTFDVQPSTEFAASDKPILSALELSLLPPILTNELKRQNITYEEMAMQIGVSISTFKRMIANPAAAKAMNLHALLKELGIKVWLEK